MFRDLLYCEARKYEIPESKIRIQGDIYTPDGGVDGYVLDSEVETPNGLIRKGIICYQVKSGENANLKDLVKKKSRIHSGVKKCLDDGGTFLGIMFNWSAPSYNPDIQGLLRNELGKGYENANVDVIAADQLVKMFECYPSLLRQILGQEASYGEDYNTECLSLR